jgi:hypothetical protein
MSPTPDSRSPGRHELSNKQINIVESADGASQGIIRASGVPERVIRQRRRDALNFAVDASRASRLHEEASITSQSK